MKILLDVFFGTGDTDLPYWQEKVIVLEDFDADELESAFDKHLMSEKVDALDFSEIVEIVLKESGLRYETISGDRVPACDKSIDIWL